jgi:outer membrane protein OmpA-like peptidoglycan-associated protein
MNTPARSFSKTLLATAAASLLLAACSTTPAKPAGAEAVRNKLTQLQSDPQLASRAPVAIKDAELAVRAAEEPRNDHALEQHLVLIADRKVDIAWAQAQARYSEDQRKTLSEQRESARLESRTREADKARSEAKSANTDAAIARSQASSARTDAAVARSDASSARTDADIARSQADVARMDTEAARQQSDDLQRQIAELNAKSTDRGLVVTLGDVLFATGRSELKGGAASNLSKLSAFLNKYPDRTVIIEGHTDSVGSEDSNLGLSQRRADAVKSYLVNQGVDSGRLAATGKGEGSPTAGNDSTTGRQQNRRVEVIISNAVTSSR